MGLELHVYNPRRPTYSRGLQTSGGVLRLNKGTGRPELCGLSVEGGPAGFSEPVCLVGAARKGEEEGRSSVPTVPSLAFSLSLYVFSISDLADAAGRALPSLPLASVFSLPSLLSFYLISARGMHCGTCGA